MPLSGPFFSTYWFDRPYREYRLQKERLLGYIQNFPGDQSFAQIKVSKTLCSITGYFVYKVIETNLNCPEIAFL